MHRVFFYGSAEVFKKSLVDKKKTKTEVYCLVWIIFGSLKWRYLLYVYFSVSLFLSHQPFVIYDVETLWKAESGLVWSQLVPGAPLTKEIGVHVFYRCQCTTVETVRELTEFAKCIPGFVDLYLNDQVRRFVE